MSQNKRNIISSFEEKVKEIHPKFMEALRELYPLIVLSSFSIVIANFSQTNFVGAQSYAVGAAAVFLFAFICSFGFKLSPNWLLALLTYICVGFGVALYVLIIIEFAKTVTVSLTFLLIRNTSESILVALIALVSFRGSIRIFREWNKIKSGAKISSSLAAFSLIVVLLTSIMGLGALTDLVSTVIQSYSIISGHDIVNADVSAQIKTDGFILLASSTILFLIVYKYRAKLLENETKFKN